MNEHAFDILRSLNLRLPDYYSLQTIEKQSPNKKYYLRYSKSSGLQNMLIMGHELLRQKDKYLTELEENKLIYIESTYNSIGGGVTLVKKDFIYTEYVEGHVSALLRRGLCGYRIIINKNGHYRLIKTFQRFRALQKKKYFWSATSGPLEIRATNIIKKIYPLISIAERDYLIEWLETPKEVVFCDIRDKGLNGFGNDLIKLFELKSVRDLIVFDRLTKSEGNSCVVDNFDVDLCKPPEDNSILYCMNSSILNHFIVRNLNKNLKIILGDIKYERDRTSCPTK